MDTNKNGLYIVGMVGIVAIVAIVITILNGSTRNSNFIGSELSSEDSFGQVIAGIDMTPRIAYWSGKVNQHTVNGIWYTDPDGRSGAGLDKLTYCKKWYPATTSVAAYKLESISGFRDAGNTGNYTGTVQTYQCLVADMTPRIAYWSGKVNQHTVNGIWYTDPDGTSGANIDKLTYCKKWYPATTSVAAYKLESISGFRDAGNTGGPYTATLQSYNCVNTPLTCSGSNNQTCAIIGGTGIQYRTCNSGTWSAWGNCQATSCKAELGYVLDGTTCVQDPAIANNTPYCTDTDNGVNLNVKGTITTSATSTPDKFYNNAVDSCTLRYQINPTTTQYNATTSCPNSMSNCLITEYFCENKNGVHPYEKAYRCPNGCNNGVCY
jgi:hypothetical protein